MLGLNNLEIFNPLKTTDGTIVKPADILRQRREQEHA